MRALLVYNPNATTTTPAVTDVIAHALGDQLKLDVASTKRRDHASFIAAGAVHDGYEVVVALGGDGTVNEVMQGVAGTDVKLAIIPGGSTNVWARSLGLPNDAVEATSVLLAKLAEREDRRIPLGRVTALKQPQAVAHQNPGRWFGFHAGFGFDAEVVRAVERRARMKRTVRQATFVWAGVLGIAGGYDRRTTITVAPGSAEAVEGLRSAVICNSDPYTYFQRWPVHLCPDAELDGGLDVLGLHGTGFWRIARLVRASLVTGNVPKLRFARSWHDLDEVTLTADRPTPLQVDGDYLGEIEHAVVRSVPHALTIVA